MLKANESMSTFTTVPNEIILDADTSHFSQNTLKVVTDSKRTYTSLSTVVSATIECIISAEGVENATSVPNVIVLPA
jgi:hypothetical protein